MKGPGDVPGAPRPVSLSPSSPGSTWKSFVNCKGPKNVDCYCYGVQGKTGKVSWTQEGTLAMRFRVREQGLA